MPSISTIICTRNPRRNHLDICLKALAEQSIPSADCEFILVDNGSSPELGRELLPLHMGGWKLVRETNPGLTQARLAGIRAAAGDVLVFVDDDNVLDPDYLLHVSRAFQASPSLAAAGGPIRGEFESPPPEWTREFHGLLALHDHGENPLWARGGPDTDWPTFAPVGAGLCLRRTAALAYATQAESSKYRRSLDRRGNSLASGGDNDMVFTALENGGDVAYLPALRLSHLIPRDRLTASYLARINYSIQQSWVRVLSLHGKCPWPAIPSWTVPLRQARAWLRESAWSGPASYVRWRGLCGRFAGQAALEPSR